MQGPAQTHAAIARGSAVTASGVGLRDANGQLPGSQMSLSMSEPDLMWTPSGRSVVYAISVLAVTDVAPVLMAGSAPARSRAR